GAGEQTDGLGQLGERVQPRLVDAHGRHRNVRCRAIGCTSSTSWPAPTEAGTSGAPPASAPVAPHSCRARWMSASQANAMIASPHASTIGGGPDGRDNVDVTRPAG